MGPWPSWPPNAAPDASGDPIPPRPRRRRLRWTMALGVLPALAAAVHLAAMLVAPAAAPPCVTVLVQSPSTSTAGAASSAPPAPVAPPAPAAPNADALLRAFAGVAVNEAHPATILAWSTREVAITVDDGATWHRWSLPGTDGSAPPVGTVTGRGLGLLSLGLQGWLHVRADGIEGVVPPFGGVVTTFASDARRTVALMSEPDDVNRTIVSVDAGATWRAGLEAPQGAYGVTLLAGGRIAVPYAWTASCGGGAEGVVTMHPGATEWTAVEQRHVGHLAPDLRIVSGGCGDTGDVLCASPTGADATPLLGPRSSSAAGSNTWFASGRAGTFAGDGTTVYRVEVAGFRAVERAAPASPSSVVVDGRGRLVGLANGHVVRWTPPGERSDAEPGAAARWRVFLP